MFISQALESGLQDSNLRPPGPKPGTLPTALNPGLNKNMAEEAGFEPAVQFPVRQFSKLLVSATHPSLQAYAHVKTSFSKRGCKYIAI